MIVDSGRERIEMYISLCLWLLTVTCGLLPTLVFFYKTYNQPLKKEMVTIIR